MQKTPQKKAKDRSFTSAKSQVGAPDSTLFQGSLIDYYKEFIQDHFVSKESYSQVAWTGASLPLCWVLQYIKKNSEPQLNRFDHVKSAFDSLQFKGMSQTGPKTLSRYDWLNRPVQLWTVPAHENTQQHLRGLKNQEIHQVKSQMNSCTLQIG